MLGKGGVIGKLVLDTPQVISLSRTDDLFFPFLERRVISTLLGKVTWITCRSDQDHRVADFPNLAF